MRKKCLILKNALKKICSLKACIKLTAQRAEQRVALGTKKMSAEKIVHFTHVASKKF
jgi:hypothetical protein